MQRIKKPATAINFAFFTLTTIGILIISLVFVLTTHASSIQIKQWEREEICSSVLWGHSSENQDIVDQVYGCKNYWRKLVLTRKI